MVKNERVMLKVVHINTSDTGGGAAIAAVRHVEAMRRAGIDAAIVCIKKDSDKQFVYPVVNSKLALFFDLVKEKVMFLFQKHCLSTVGTFSINYSSHRLHKLPIIQDADVIFLHWVNRFVNTNEIEKLLRLGKPTFWFMHDMYPITGGCHHALDCNKFTVECHSCPMIKKRFLIDFAKNNFSKKIRSLGKYKNLTFVTPSNWLGTCVKNSRIGAGHAVITVPNVINTNLFIPLNIDAKQMLGLNPHKKTILFSACDFSSIYKGSKYVYECLRRCDPNLYEGLVIGNINKDLLNSLPINVICTGRLHDELALVVAYNACDTFVISSIAENYPNVVLEAMSCGKPCIGFPTGGIPELIQHEISGYVTKGVSVEELIEGIQFIFKDEERYKQLSVNARRQIVSNNSYERVLDIHFELNEILNSSVV